MHAQIYNSPSTARFVGNTVRVLFVYPGEVSVAHARRVPGLCTAATLRLAGGKVAA